MIQNEYKDYITILIEYKLKMPPTCVICTNKQINYSNKCLTCKKCVCNYCFDRISLVSVYKNDEILNEYKCPFCKTEKVDDLEDLDKGVLIEMTKTAIVNLKELVFKKNEMELYYKNKLNEINQIKDIYDTYKKMGRKIIKLEELKKMI